MAIEIVSFPIQYVDIVHRYVSLPEGISEISDFSYSEPLITDREHLFFRCRVDQIQPCGAKHGRFAEVRGSSADLWSQLKTTKQSSFS